MEIRSYELQMLDLFRLHFFGSRRSPRTANSEISPNQTFVLSELVRRESPSLDELKGVLKLHLSSLSRAIAYLNQVGLVSSTKDPHDSRRLRTIPSEKGIALARESWRSQQSTIEQRLRGFSPIEHSSLENFLKIFVGEDAYRRIIPIPDEPEMAIISRALTYDHGVVSDNYLESGYSVLDWIILSEIHYEKRSPSELARLCHTPPSTISLRLRRFQAKGLIAVSKGTHDRRAREFELLPKGKSELQLIEESARKYFARTLRTLTTTDIERGLELFGRYVHALVGDLKIEYQIEKVAKGTLDALRHSLLNTLSKLGEGYPLTAILLHPENQTLTLKSNSHSLLILECKLQESGAFDLINAIPLLNDGAFPHSDLLVKLVEKYLGAPVKVRRDLKIFIDSLTDKVLRRTG